MGSDNPGTGLKHGRDEYWTVKRYEKVVRNSPEKRTKVSPSMKWKMKQTHWQIKSNLKMEKISKKLMPKRKL